MVEHIRLATNTFNNYITKKYTKSSKMSLNTKKCEAFLEKLRINEPEIPWALAAWASIIFPLASPMQYKWGTYINKEASERCSLFEDENSGIATFHW